MFPGFYTKYLGPVRLDILDLLPLLASYEEDEDENESENSEQTKHHP